MSAYLGPLGGLVEIECPSSLRPTMERPFAEKSTTSGILRQQVSQRTARQWDFAVGVATPSEAAQLAAIVAGEFGYGPFWFVDPWAQVTNLLAPRASTLDGDAHQAATLGGPVTAADGSRIGRTMIPNDPTAIRHVNYLDGAMHRVPVVPRRDTVGSIFATGPSTVDVRLQWYDAAGAFLSNTGWRSTPPGSALVRCWQSGTAPDGAASVSVQARGASRFARPAVTWTTVLMDWHVGQGAPSVAIPATLAQDIILATRDPKTGRYATVSTTIREVG